MSNESGSTFVAETGRQDMNASRVFNAPREVVFGAFTNPELVAQWWGPKSLTTTVDELEPRAGGRWRFVHHDAEGNEYGFHGVYHDVVTPERMVYTFEFEGMPGHVLMETVTFEDLGAQTRVTTSSVFQSVEDRDGMISSGAEEGARESWDRLDALLTAL